MKITPCRIADVRLIEPDVFGDARGFFLEAFHQQKFAQQGLDASFVQDNHSRSARGVLRGLHYQLERPQGKLVRVVSGEVFDVAVDIRRGSPSFGQWVGEILSDHNHRMLYVPPGFAHGFCVLSDSADFLYKCTDFYDASDEHAIAWDDPQIGIDWPDGPFLLSDKDRGNRSLAEMQDFLPRYTDSNGNTP